MGDNDVNVLIDSQINEKLKRIMEQRNIRSDHYKRTWLELITVEKETVIQEDIEIKTNKILNLNTEDEIYLFDNLTGACLGLFYVISIKEESEILTVNLRKLTPFTPTLNIKEVLSNEEVSTELKNKIVEIIGGGKFD